MVNFPKFGGALPGVVLCAVALASAQHSPGDPQPAHPSDTLSVTGESPLPEKEVHPSYHLPEWHEMITRVPGDWARFISATFSEGSLTGIASLSALTAALIVSDDDSWRASDRVYRRSRQARDVSDFFVSLGDGAIHFGLAGGFAAYGFLKDDHRALRTASQITEAVIACGVTVQVLKHITGRERPERASRKRGYWRYLPNQIEYHKNMPKYDAFPSGHISTAFATVTVLVENYPEVKWLKPTGYVLVGLIGVSLVNKGWHWYSDLPLGLVLGYQFGKIAANPEGIRILETQPGGRSGVSITPFEGIDGTGVMVSYHF